MQRTCKSAQRKRDGFSMVEAVVATVLMGCLCSILFPVLSRLLIVQQEVEQRQFAVRELRNLVERGLYTSADADPVLRPAVLEELPDAQLKIKREVEPANGERVELMLSWDAGVARPRAEVQLSYWVPVQETVE